MESEMYIRKQLENLAENKGSVDILHFSGACVFDAGKAAPP